MSTLAEIKKAIDRLNPHDRAILAAELFAAEKEPAMDDPQLQTALARGLADVEAGRTLPIEDVRGMIPKWISKS
jgi:predicted transcriptional regulator